MWVDLTRAAICAVALVIGLAACSTGGGDTPPPPPAASVTLTVATAGGGTGTVTSNPAGLNCGTTCTLTVSSGTVVTLTAAPAPNTTLTDWGGVCPAGTATCAVTVNSNQTVTATFNPSSANPSLSVVFAGTGAGSVTCNGGACNATYPWGTSITVAGVPNGNSSFAGWSGGGCTGTAPCTVLLWANTQLTATFNLLPVTAQLSVSKAGNGGGTVTSVPAGINCGATCASNFPGGTVVTLTATAATGSTFTGWSGGGCAGTGTCVVTLNANAAVTATFNTIPPTVTLTTATNGTGTGTVTCNGGVCQPSYPSGTALTIVATPAATSLFTGWSGTCAASGTATTCNLTITANSTVSATFNLPTLSVVVAGTGTVTSNPAGINCGATCAASFNRNTAITLTVTGANFSGWSGGGCSGSGTCAVTLTQNTTVTATFGVVSSGANIFVSTGATTGTYLDPRIIDDGSGGTIIVWHSSEFTHKLQAQRYNAAGIPQWGANGIIVCCTINLSTITDVQVTTDGAGGAIVVWTDWRRYPSPTDLFAQRVNSAGVIQWGNDGLPIAASDEIEDDPRITSDGAGGGIIAYHRQTQGCGSGCGGAYVQRVTSAGVTQWTTNGVLLSDRSFPAYQSAHARLVSDGSGGAIVAWHGNTSQIFAQRVNAAGVPQWAANGIAITDYPTDSFGPTGSGGYPEVAIDGSGGAIIVWRGGDRTSGSGIRGQRVNSNGVQQWITNGIIIYLHNSSTTPTGLKAVSDGASGALLVWSDNRNGSDPDVYAQRVTGAGGIAWAADGIAVSAGLGRQELPSNGVLSQFSGPTITPDGASGGIIVWQDSRSISSYDIYAQHLNANGNAQWAANGLAISTALNDQTYPVITTDGSGGAWMAWMDKRNDPGNFTADIYAQHVTNAGTLP